MQFLVVGWLDVTSDFHVRRRISCLNLASWRWSSFGTNLIHTPRPTLVVSEFFISTSYTFDILAYNLILIPTHSILYLIGGYHDSLFSRHQTTPLLIMSDYEPPSQPPPPPQLSLNIPQLVAFLLISALAVRWLFFSSSSSSRNNASPTSSSSSSTITQSRGRRIDERHVEQVQAIFPQYGRREILWDLMRNGGSVQATTERILGGRGLDNVFCPSPYSPSIRTLH